MVAIAESRFRFIKTFGVLSTQQLGEEQCRSLREALISGRIGFVSYSGNFYVFNVSVDTLSYYASLAELPSFIYCDGAFKRYVYENKRIYSPVDDCSEIEVPQKIFREVDRCLADNLKQLKGFDNPSDAIDFIVSRVGFYPYYLRANINRGIYENLIYE